MAKDFLDDWATSLLADPVTKLPAAVEDFALVRGVVDARVLLKNTHGYQGWIDGQDHWEGSVSHIAPSPSEIAAEIARDRPIYDRFKAGGSVLDVGGWIGLIREYLPLETNFISIDPFIGAPHHIPTDRRDAYACLSRPLNFLGATAEFLPFRAESFDWVHMRSMLDHVQVPDLALLEARRVLKPGGNLLIGMYVEGGRSGREPFVQQVKHGIKAALEQVGVSRYKDHHTWHPTYANLKKMIVDAGFSIRDEYWQPEYVDQVVFIHASRP